MYRRPEDLKFHPHCILVMHELESPDREQWIQYCRWFTHFIQGDMAISDKVSFTDKVWLYLSRHIIAKMTDNIVLKIPKPSVRLLHSLKSGVWYGVYRQRVIAFIFVTRMVTLEHHHEAITNFIFLLEAGKKTAGFNKIGPCYTDHIQQHKCCMNSLVIALLPKNGGLFSHQYQEYQTSVFMGFWKIVHRQQPT